MPMGFLNRKKNRAPSPHLNFMGGPSYDITDPLQTLRVTAASCFFGEPMYYARDVKDTRPQRPHRGRLNDLHLAHLQATLGALDPGENRTLTPAQRLERAIDAALDADPAGTLALAAELRGEWNIRVTPQVILVRAANHAAVRGTGLIREHAPGIIRRPDEPATGLAYQLSAYGKPIPNSLKKAWKRALEQVPASALAKYRLEGRDVKTLDVVNLVHAFSPAIDGLMRGTAKLEGETWESLISAKGSGQPQWTEAVQVMGHMALLRNLRNLVKHGVAPELFTEKLVAGAARGKQLPFRYYSAYRAVKEASAPHAVLTAVEDALEVSLGELPHFPGRVMSLCDNSGSAQGTATSSMGQMQVSTIANLSAVLTARRADEGHVGVFGDRLETFRVQGRVMPNLERAERLAQTIGGATENGIWLFWDRAIRERQHWDHVFVYSDMQAGHGGLYGTDVGAYKAYVWPGGGHYIDVPKLIQTYREQVNPQVMVYLVQVAGYSDTIVPETYRGTFILGGWGDGLLRYAHAMSQQFRA
ncbi:TROVE domain-containing protein [Deinococcus aquaedulcis]|uniref:TROVE domain-containing protein n=1 Tax=Deinococcus aquaedulcis TaxID=2840455 RepID=UPI001C83D6C0|nr:TROVE domain-containing protein [Deinococcus aquaedulcis]